MTQSPYFAAIDLGSNSFHMLVARLNDGQLEIVDREKEMVQIARGLNEKGELDEQAKTRALECLNRFSERLRHIPAEQVRAVGTKTLRASKNAKAFLRSAEKKLGHPIEIISGYEEARLVYCGLAHSISKDNTQRLVVDIGGGSTEFIIGQDDEPSVLESLSLGCVAFTNRYFKNGDKFAEKMKRAYMAACSEIETIRKTYQRRGWKIAYGTSGTIKAIGDLAAGSNHAILQREDLDQLKRETIESGGAFKSSVPKLRRDVLPAGIAILSAVFDQLKLEQLHVADATLKEGLIFDTVGRFSNDDSREFTVRKIMQRYAVDEDQAERVKNTALYLWEPLKDCLPNLQGVSRTKALKWAALLHETGLSVSHSSYHHHGHYLLRYGDLAGFGRFEQYVLASLVRLHRKKVKQDHLDGLDESAQLALLPLMICLRLAVKFNRRREDCEHRFKLSINADQFVLSIDPDWLSENPLTTADIYREIDYLKAVDITLQLENMR